MRKAFVSAIVAVTAVALAGGSSDNTDGSVAAPATPGSSSVGIEDSSPSTPGASIGNKTPITITAGDVVVIRANLNDSRVWKDFAAMLPVTLPWFRNSGIEYISELSKPLTETGPFYTDVQPCDLVYVSRDPAGLWRVRGQIPPGNRSPG